MSAAATASLRCEALVKSYAGVVVLDHVDFEITRGSVVGLVGENGAGKSTLSNIIAGVVAPDSGSMTINGEPYAPVRPADALSSGVVLIHQEIRMVPHLSVAENLFLGRPPVRRGVVDRAAMYRQTREALGLLGVDLDPRQPVGGLPVAAQQEIEIAKALTRNPQYVVFDEPSASLGQDETERVLERVAVLREHGAGVVYISHKLEEVRTIADEVVCLRDGQRVASWDHAEVSADDVVRAMVGRDLLHAHEEPPTPREEVVLDVRGLARDGAFEGIDFSLHAGEILGVAGLIGAGRTEMVRVLAGADVADAGEVRLDGRPVAISNVRSAVRHGIHMVPEDRKQLGLNLSRSAVNNVTLPWERQLTASGVITTGHLREVAEETWADLDIRGRADAPVVYMSGGNQQKVLLGKWLVHTPRVLILDEPTRGVDVGAKASIYQIIRDLAAEGVALIVVSSELEEVLGLSHRVLVMSGGRQRGVLSRSEATPEAVMRLAVPAAASATEPLEQQGA